MAGAFVGAGLFSRSRSAFITLGTGCVAYGLGFTLAGGGMESGTFAAAAVRVRVLLLPVAKVLGYDLPLPKNPKTEITQ